MLPKIYLQVLIGGVVGLYAYFVYSQSMSTINALTIILLGSLLFYGFRSGLVAWNTIKLLKNPYIIGLIFLGVGFAYITSQGLLFRPSTYFSAGTGLIGLAVGLVIYGVWNLR